MDMIRCEVAVLGGGLVGSALAVGLARHGLNTVLIERTDPQTHAAPDFDGRAYAVTPGSANLLTALGVWPDVVGHAQPIARIAVQDRTDGPAPTAGLVFDPAEAGRQSLGWIVEDHVLRRALLTARDCPDLRVLAPAEVTEIDRTGTGALVHLADGPTVRAATVIAVDGRRSALSRAAGISYLGWEYGQTGLVAAIAHDTPHNGLAHQGFFPGGPFAVLPMQGNRSALVWSERSKAAERIAALPDASYLQAIQARLGGRLGALDLIGKRWAYPLGFALAQTYAVPRMAVAGDAAHGVHPIAGQGLNLGLADAAALIEVLVEAARRGEDIGVLDVLSRYQHSRRFEATRLALGIDGLNRLFSTDFGPAQALRNLGLTLIGKSGAARRTFANLAAGDAAQAPRLLTGKAL